MSRTTVWVGAAAAALLWPARAIGPLDGVPLDSRTEAIAIGLLLPVLCGLHPGFLRTAWARGVVAALLAVKAAGALFLAQQGWCERLIVPAPLNQDADTLQRAWDARVDWRRAVPGCSAILARPYADLQSFPAWFLNLAEPAGRAPDAGVLMTVDGYVSAPAPGIMTIDVSDGQRVYGTVDDAPVDETSRTYAMTAGTHHVRLRTVLRGESWRFVPAWNGRNLFESVLTTVSQPGAIDRAVSRAAPVAASVLAAALLASWTLAAALALAPGALASAWIAVATAGAAAAGVASANSGARIAALLLVGAAFVPLPPRLRGARGAFLLVGLPWLALVAGSSIANAGRITLFTPGDDFTFFQRFAYRIYMQGYWLEGGQPTFWNQPLYRWILGPVHWVFGDSSIGESYLDAGWLWVGASFAFVVCARLVSFRAGVAAAALMLATVAIGPSWWIVGRDLSEITAAGFAYAAALLLVRGGATVWRSLMAGLLAVLCFYTRLNHLLWMFALIALLLPLDVSAARIWRPREWLSRVPVVSASIIAASLAIGLALFAWRTWYYTGVFSVFYGTQRQLVATIQPTDTAGQAIVHLIESLLVLVTVQDPPRFDPRALLVVAGVAVSLLALLRVPRCRDMPAGPALFCAAGLAGALVARGTAYVGRFSIHLMPVAVAMATCFGATILQRVRPAAPMSPV